MMKRLLFAAVLACLPVGAQAQYAQQLGNSSSIISGATPCTGCAAGGLLEASGSPTVVQSLATANNGVLVTNGVGVPSISTTLPSGLAFAGTTTINGQGQLIFNASGSGGLIYFNTTDTYFHLFNRASGNVIAIGDNDVASPVAQTLRSQSVATGNLNTAGANLILQVSAGTGTGVGGSLVVQTAPAGMSASTPNAFATAWSLGSTGLSSTVGTTNGYQFADRSTSGTATLFRNAGAGALFDSGFGANVMSWSGSSGNVGFGAAILAGLSSVAQTNVVCWNSSTGLFSFQVSATGCAASASHYKDLHDSTPLNVAGLGSLRTDVPWSYRKDSELYEDGKIHVGLLADDVEMLDPRCVTYLNGKVHNYEDRCVLAYLVSAYQEMKREKRQ